jgi:hypothetical protein
MTAPAGVWVCHELHRIVRQADRAPRAAKLPEDSTSFRAIWSRDLSEGIDPLDELVAETLFRMSPPAEEPVLEEPEAQGVSPEDRLRLACCVARVSLRREIWTLVSVALAAAGLPQVLLHRRISLGIRRSALMLLHRLIDSSWMAVVSQRR